MIKCRNCDHYYSTGIDEDLITEECHADWTAGITKEHETLGEYNVCSFEFWSNQIDVPIRCPYRLEYLLEDDKTCNQE